MRPPELRLYPGEIIVDNFAGGGGASLGIEMALGRSPDIAINHDAQAVAMHQANHPATQHYVEDVWKVDPVKACAGRKVGLAWFSPDCKHFSKAKGGKPVSKKIRGLAWVVVRWAKAVRPRVIILENVEEFQTWGPLTDDNKPCPIRRGMTFRNWKARLENLGYTVEHRELVAADYGAPTTRKRLFLVARCDGQPIVWPEPTHGPGRPQPYRTAAECIDWSLPCPSIFDTSAQIWARYGVRAVRPLAENTLRRIGRGLEKFVINNPRPFIVPLTHQGSDRVESVDEPMRTITGAHRGERAVVMPYLAKFRGQSPGTAADEPLHTITAGPKDNPAGAAHGMGLIAPTLVQTGYGEREGQQPRALDLGKPLGTVVAGAAKHALVGAFLAQHYGGNYEGPGAQADNPLPTITARDHNAVVASSLVKMRGDNVGQENTEPLQTVSAQGNHFAEVRAFLVAYYGNERDGGDLFDPARTITSRERFGLVTVNGQDYQIADIGMRMLVPPELYLAQGFPPGYQINIEFNGKPLPKDAQVRMVGNSVCPPMAAAMVRAQFCNQQMRSAA